MHMCLETTLFLISLFQFKVLMIIRLNNNRLKELLRFVTVQNRINEKKLKLSSSSFTTFTRKNIFELNYHKIEELYHEAIVTFVVLIR